MSGGSAQDIYVITTGGIIEIVQKGLPENYFEKVKPRSLKNKH